MLNVITVMVLLLLIMNKIQKNIIPRGLQLMHYIITK